MMMIMIIIVIDGCFVVVCYISSIIISSLFSSGGFSSFYTMVNAGLKAFWLGPEPLTWCDDLLRNMSTCFCYQILSPSLLLLLWTSMLFAKYIIFFHIISTYKLKYTLNSNHHYHLRWLCYRLQCPLCHEIRIGLSLFIQS